MFLTNKLSGLDAFSLASARNTAGEQVVPEFATAGASGSRERNLRRDLMRRIYEESKWPPLYYIEVPTKNVRTQQREMTLMPVLLPHEALQCIAETVGTNRMRQFLARPDHAPHLQTRIQSFCERWNRMPSRVVPMGLHGDGVPFAAKMTDSLELLSWNIPTLVNSPRIVFAAYAKSTAYAQETADALLTVFAWSLKILKDDHWPEHDHEGDPFRSRTWRGRQAGKPLEWNAALCELRGDWAFYRATFRFPSWASTSICWKCAATQTGQYSFKETGPHARWRLVRRTGAEFLEQLAAAGITQSPIFSAPSVSVDYVMIDWLHTVVLGVSTDYLGNLFDEVLDIIPGTRKQAVLHLWSLIQRFYRQHRPSSQLQTLTVEMIRAPGKAPKLRAKAAECRYLVPFGAELAHPYNDGSPHRSTVAACGLALSRCYEVIESVPYEASEAAAACGAFLSAYATLGDAAAPTKWRMKPKFHLFQELIQFQTSCPRQFWTYSDETWGAVYAQAAARRGGATTAKAIAENTLMRFSSLISPKF